MRKAVVEQRKKYWILILNYGANRRVCTYLGNANFLWLFEIGKLLIFVGLILINWVELHVLTDDYDQAKHMDKNINANKVYFRMKHNWVSLS